MRPLNKVIHEKKSSVLDSKTLSYRKRNNQRTKLFFFPTSIKEKLSSVIPQTPFDVSIESKFYFIFVPVINNNLSISLSS